MKSRLILCGMALASATVSHAAYTPLALQASSYTADVVVESNATPRLTIATTASIDEGTNNYNATLFEQGRDINNPLNGLPPAGTVITSFDNANYSFQMPQTYVGPNGILMDSAITNGVLTPVTPHAYTSLSFLGLGGNGGDTILVRVYHQDGTTETGTFSTPDWFGNGTGIAIIMNGRINQVYNLNTETDGSSGGFGNPRVYHREITLTDTASAVTNLVLSYVSGNSGSHSDVFAVSGALTGGGSAVVPIPVTGFDYDFVVEAAAPASGRIVSQTMVASTNVWATDNSLDNEANTGASWYEQGYNLNNDASGTYNNPAHDLTGTGIPHPSAFLTNSTGDHIYQMPPSYTAPDAVYISDADGQTNATITLTTPTVLTGLSFLGSAGNGPVPVNYVITHTGGITEKGVLSIGDWFNGSAAAALIANGRVVVDTAFFQNINSGFPRLLQNDIVLTDTTDPVVSIYLENTNGISQGHTSGRFSILAVSGSAGALPPAITIQPVSTNLFQGSIGTFTSGASANASLTYQWQKGTNGVYVNLSNGGNISGATTTVLTVNPVGFADQASYRMVATDVAGSVPSGAAALVVYSTTPDVTQPGDAITGVNISPFGDGAPANAIDNTMSTKFGANISGGISGLVITPAAGRTIVGAVRIYTGSDATGRDPTSFKLEGSLNGGATYTLIASNSIALSDNRNPLTGVAPDPLSQWDTEVRFPNTSGYTTYRITFPTLKGSGQVQFDELELLGTIDTSKPFFSTQPVDANAYGAPTGLGPNSATFNAVATFTPTPTISWSKGTNGVYVPLTDGGNISGSQSTSLTVNPTTFADAADYIAIANSTAGFVTSSIAHLYIFSTNTDVTQPGDPTVAFGDTSTGHGANADPLYAIDNTFTEYINGGSGPNNNGGGGGFPPFNGPVGFTVTPTVGSTILVGVRFYPGQDPADADPLGYTLEGSNNGGTNYTVIASGPLALPLTRNGTGGAVDPVQSAAQEILFSNTKSFTSYRLTFPNVVNSNTVSYLDVGDVELLGVPGVAAPQPLFGHPTFVGGNLGLSGSGGTPGGTFSVLTNAVLTAPLANWGTNSTGTFDGSGNFSISLPVSAAKPALYYRIKTP